MTPEEQIALDIARVVFDHFGILWPKNYQDHTGDLIERLKPILVAALAAQRERDANVADFRAFEWRDILDQHPDDAMANQRWREACNIGTLIRQY